MQKFDIKNIPKLIICKERYDGGKCIFFIGVLCSGIHIVLSLLSISIIMNWIILNYYNFLSIQEVNKLKVEIQVSIHLHYLVCKFHCISLFHTFDFHEYILAFVVGTARRKRETLAENFELTKRSSPSKISKYQTTRLHSTFGNSGRNSQERLSWRCSKVPVRSWSECRIGSVWEGSSWWRSSAWIGRRDHAQWAGAIKVESEEDIAGTEKTQSLIILCIEQMSEKIFERFWNPGV